MKLEPVSLETLGQGALVEMFDRELRKVLEDIDDPNTKAEKIRTITIEVKIKPTESREAAAVQFNVHSKVAGLTPRGTVIHLAEHGGKLVALAQPPNQIEAFAAIDGGKGKD